MIHVIQLTLFAIFTAMAALLFMLGIFQKQARATVALSMFGFIFMWLAGMAYHPYVTTN